MSKAAEPLFPISVTLTGAKCIDFLQNYVLILQNLSVSRETGTFLYKFSSNSIVFSKNHNQNPFSKEILGIYLNKARILVNK